MQTLNLSGGSSSHVQAILKYSQPFPVVTHFPLVTTTNHSYTHYQLLFLSKVQQTLRTVPKHYSALKVKFLNWYLGLSARKSTGPDEISARILKGTINSIVPSLTKIFNLSIQTSSFPELWKCAPVLKKGDVSSPENYCLICTLTPKKTSGKAHLPHCF